ncbi:MAG: hypothetical protein QF371_09475 [Flavobacteriales bacterium]|jgi:hypothetical protein|nr:hypothetical protein [Flavobacteriales bacterium]
MGGAPEEWPHSNARQTRPGPRNQQLKWLEVERTVVLDGKVVLGRIVYSNVARIERLLKLLPAHINPTRLVTMAQLAPPQRLLSQRSS